MCKFLLLTLPPQTDLPMLEASIPERLRQSIIARGLGDPSAEAYHFGLDRVDSSLGLPARDDIVVRCTRVHCDCWSTLASPVPDRKELSRLRRIFDFMHLVVPRFGLLVHFGDPTDSINLSAPVVLSMSNAAPLHGLAMETLYEVVP